MQNLRFTKVQKLLSEKQIDTFLVTTPSNIFYLTGFSGVSQIEREAVCLIDQSFLTLIIPSIYQNEANLLSKLNPLKIIVSKDIHHFFTDIIKLLHDNTNLGVETANLRLSEFEELQKKFTGNIIKTFDLIEQIRIQKHQDEIVLINKAVRITDRAFKAIKSEVKIGMTEKELSRKIIELMEDLGSDGVAFEPIVASGINSTLPHYKTSNTKITKGILLIDAGAKYKGYCADLTRTFYIGKPSQKFMKRYLQVLNTQKKALNLIKIGIEEQKPWRKAYDSLGIDKRFFTHGLGHGVGIDIHEEPYLRRGRNKKLLKNTVVTIEPGIYYPGWGGIRIEDFIFLSEKGPIVLSNTPRNLEEMIIN